MPPRKPHSIAPTTTRWRYSNSSSRPSRASSRPRPGSSNSSPRREAPKELIAEWRAKLHQGRMGVSSKYRLVRGLLRGLNTLGDDGQAVRGGATPPRPPRRFLDRLGGRPATEHPLTGLEALKRDLYRAFRVTDPAERRAILDSVLPRLFTCHDIPTRQATAAPPVDDAAVLIDFEEALFLVELGSSDHRPRLPAARPPPGHALRLPRSAGLLISSSGFTDQAIRDLSSIQPQRLVLCHLQENRPAARAGPRPEGVASRQGPGGRDRAEALRPRRLTSGCRHFTESVEAHKAPNCMEADGMTGDRSPSRYVILRTRVYAARGLRGRSALSSSYGIG